MTVSAGYTAAAALAGAATVLEMTKAGRSVMEILGWRKPERTMLSAAERTFNCHLWIGFTWRPCVLGMAGDLLVLSGRFVEEARLMESAHVSVQDFYASVALLVGDPLQLCFHSAEEAQSFAMEVRQRACLKKDMMKLADQAKDLRESLSSATLSSDVSKRSSRRPSKTAEREKEAQMAQALRTRLAVPKGVPMYTLSPCASGELERLDEIPRLPKPSFKAPALAPPPVAPVAPPVAPLGIPREVSESSMSQPDMPKLKIHRANSCPSPSKHQQLSGDSSTASDLTRAEHVAQGSRELCVEGLHGTWIGFREGFPSGAEARGCAEDQIRSRQRQIQLQLSCSERLKFEVVVVAALASDEALASDAMSLFSGNRNESGDCLVRDSRHCNIQELQANARIYGRMQTTCLDESMNSNWSDVVEVITRPACTWTYDSSIQGAAANELECVDKTFCDFDADPSCCSSAGGRLRCPQNYPVMCENQDCVGSTDYCCVSTEAECSVMGTSIMEFRVGLRTGLVKKPHAGFRHFAHAIPPSHRNSQPGVVHSDSQPMAPPCCFEKIFQSCFPKKADDHEPTFLEKLADKMGMNKFVAHVVMDGTWIGGITVVQRHMAALILVHGHGQQRKYRGGSKLGAVVADLRCEYCLVLFRIQELVVSERFPPNGAPFCLADLRGAYYRALEVADSYLQSGQGGRVPPGKEESKEPIEKFTTTPKSKPPTKVESPEEETAVEAKEEEESPDKAPEREEKPRESHSERKERKRHRREEHPGGEPSSSARGHSRRRSRSREKGRVDQRKEAVETGGAEKDLTGLEEESEETLQALLMPPKGILRPAAAGGLRAPGILRRGRAVAPRGKAKAKAKAVPKAQPKRAVVRRPAAKVEEELPGDKNISEIFEAGGVVNCGDLPIHSWRTGLRVVMTEGSYWEEKVQICGVVRKLQIEDGEVYMSLKLEGTQSEALVKWAGANPGKDLQVHLCPDGCNQMSKDGLVHVTRGKKLRDGEREGWMENLVGIDRRDGGEVDELAKVRQRAEERAAETAGEQRAPKPSGVVGSSASSGSSTDAKKKKKKEKKKKKKEAKERGKIVATKELSALFSTTALDPSPAVRKRVRRKAKKAAKRRSTRTGSSSTSSRKSSSSSHASVDDAGHLFGEEVKVKTVAKRFPGALTLSALEMMQTSLVSQSGQPWDISRETLPPIYSQYWRMMLAPKMNGPMSREAQTLCYLQDMLLQGKVAMTCDSITQRLKSLEQVSQGSHYSIAQKQELVPTDVVTMTSPMESLEASRVQKEEAKAKTAASKPWSRPTDWDRRPEDGRGKGKGKEPKGKGKTKGAKSGQEREDRDKEKK
eukprot:s2_g40.t1